ncbi:exodeoxyribonuclease III [Brooklawnia cerclae]|uniref:Exodeoxyribonuclease-3 n=1 Tax=Brooklawnia cerclae TaxID=349934 RepID=A0ABX0SBN3_9ACTN|nr:exodeoxyribonuclease III [Brooklawnia cerclae]NIH55802.1 exodeoxyribonuclease-3 [Brooklawnia cerclae]
MRIATFNVNGIRASVRRGFGEWLGGRGCDVIALQEVRCPTPQLPPGAFGDYHLAYDEGDRAGRNGVALLTREPAAAVRTWRDWSESGGVLPRGLRAFASAGRYVEVDLADAPLCVASVYVPKGDTPEGDGRSDDPEGAKRRYDDKMAFLAGFEQFLVRARRAAAARGRHYLVLGDFNIAHTPLDLRNWRSNTRSAGFLPEERAWLDAQLSPRTMVDVVRTLHPGLAGPYSWWSWRGAAFANDVGWRIDYHMATPGLARLATSGGTDRDPSRDERLSDHAPVVVDYAV